MKQNITISKLEEEWEMPGGFLGALRTGIFHSEDGQRFLNILREMDTDPQHIERRLVSLTWYIPLFMTWQLERVVENGGDVSTLKKLINEIISILEEKLGTP